MSKKLDIEVVRIFSAFGVVSYHASSSLSNVAYSGLTIFLMLSGFFSANRESFSFTSIKRIAKRLLIPWLSWFLLYSTLNVITHKSVFNDDYSLLQKVLAGPSVHLWYIPFIFILLIFSNLIKLKVSFLYFTFFCWFVSCFMFIFSRFWGPLLSEFGYPYGQYIHGVSGFMIGVFISGLSLFGYKYRVMMIFLLLISIFSSFKYANIFFPYLIGFLSVLLFLNTKFISCGGVFSRVVLVVSSNMFGVYLMHIFFLLAIRKYMHLNGFYLGSTVFFISTMTVMFSKYKFPLLSKYLF